MTALNPVNVPCRTGSDILNAEYGSQDIKCPMTCFVRPAALVAATWLDKMPINIFQLLNGSFSASFAASSAFLLSLPELHVSLSN